MKGGVLDSISANLHAGLFWLTKLQRCLAGLVAMGCGAGQLWEMMDPLNFDAQACVVQHYLHCNSVPVMDSPRHWGLVKHDAWHFDGSPANRRAHGACARATINL